MSINKLIGYIAVIIIGIGFIMIAMSNILKSEIASFLQGILGGVFVVLGYTNLFMKLNKPSNRLLIYSFRI